MAKIKQIIEKDTPKGRISSIYVNGDYICKSLELPYKDNTPYVSSIPLGTYTVSKSQFWGGKHKGKKCLRFDSVPNRSGILVHSANVIDELHGCIAPGMAVLEEYQYTALESRKAFELLYDAVDTVNEWKILSNEKNEVFPQKKDSMNLLILLCVLISLLIGSPALLR